ncbi:metabolism of cobalamin associated Da [Hippocampus comes]|uniref:Metabolism of cobalamin associated Da n=1 Tax=Hippocampus comes TaxID=109280 RepID=A0A3Q2YYU2_HIPCM|nr:PREDICTED: methylmalonic aciduria and homocystinuria type D protein, mitochondrial-like [Hippocampus comes]XP_019724175.1 PREDICTED: methylmalonic aciduria and homocystinuria type D protein, mitochondrial-like [Hippocampus comes]
MPSTVLCGGGRLVRSQTLGRQILAALKLGRVRTFSTANPDEPYISVTHTESGPRTVWPDENMGPFGPQDTRFQLPGNVGFDSHLDGLEEKKSPVDRTVPDVLTAPCSSERQQFILAQFVNEFQGKLGPISKRVHKAEQYFNQTDTDCSISSCPELLRKDLELLFPTVPNTSITVVTVSQRSGRYKGAELDREQLLRKFVSGAKEMCFALWTAGYWADFIDPTTGEAFFASPLRSSSGQTGEEPRHSGFRIEMSGSCTVIRHILRGTPQFVGTVFTNAPTHSGAITRLQGLSHGLDDEAE